MKISTDTIELVSGGLFVIFIAVVAQIQDRRERRKREAIAWIEKIVMYFDKPNGHENAVGHCEEIFDLFIKYSLEREQSMRYCAADIYKKACRAQLASIEIPRQKRDEYARRIAEFQFIKPAKGANIETEQICYADEMTSYIEAYSRSASATRIYTERYKKLLELRLPGK